MSHFILNTNQLQAKPIVDIIRKQIVMPKIKKIIKVKTEDQGGLAERRIIQDLCIKLSEQQYDNQHRQNQIFINRTCQKLKKRSKFMIDKEMSQNNIEQIFKRQQDLTKEEKQKRRLKQQLNIKKLLQSMPKKIYLQQKYHNQIHLKLNILKECKNINRQKENYKRWKNQVNNSPLNSPNFKKMTFLLEKIHNSPTKNKQNYKFDTRIKTQKQQVLNKDDDNQFLSKGYFNRFSQALAESPSWLSFKVNKDQNRKYIKKIKHVKTNSMIQF